MNSYESTSEHRINDKLMRFLYGRILLREELPFTDHELDGVTQHTPGVVKVKGRYECQRCENRDPQLFAHFTCYRCKKEMCYYCRHCIMMGRVSECSLLYECAVPYHWPTLQDPLTWSGTLSPWQEKGSEAVVRAIGSRSETLIWAICGAGKTEILFQGIQKALQLGERVCIATPRTDVVLELAPRLREAFPETSISALYGGSEERDTPGQLVISTTHQLYRFKQAFNTVIVDEVDAFPYSYDTTLQNAVKKAAIDNAALLYLSATPNRTMRNLAKSSKLQTVKIPRRFHGHPLPVPRLEMCWNWSKKIQQGKLPRTLMKWLTQLQETNRNGFLFVPSIKLLKCILPLIQHDFPSSEGVHSEDLDRKEKVLRFRSGEIQLLVTTTILERGVTVPYLDVAVLGAEEDIFTESALVQIAGRAGRKADDPSGDVVFLYHTKSEAMNKAVRHINMMNKEGAHE
ncbi:DEAD/DEAH box helicase [Fictibacillus iocasae]|uniref:DEAD/DEAH box helicase n=1 Tax=Fictibacillus iocasae TaxID=2715437 RepID=A0ABW2NWN7_9BACL